MQRARTKRRTKAIARKPRRRGKNPLLESIVGGAAAGTAVVLAQKFMRKNYEDLSEGELLVLRGAEQIRRITPAGVEVSDFVLEPAKRARIIKKLLPKAKRLLGKKGAKDWLRVTSKAVVNPTVPEKHQIRIAKDTLKMSDAGARIMGGMTKEQAREILRKHGIRFKENSQSNRRERWVSVGSKRGLVGMVLEVQGGPGSHRHRLYIPGMGARWVSGRVYDVGAPAERGMADKFKRNPEAKESGAAKGYADFHGRSPKEVLEMTETHLQSGDYFSLGYITGLWLRKVAGDPNGWGRATLEFDKKDGVLLAASEDSNRQLYILGDDCCISLQPLRDLGLDTGKQFIPLGPVYGIGYLTEKKFDGFQTQEYAHRFGDVTGEVPSAFYDKKAKRILLVGGGYSIAPLDGEMGASPGIVN